MAVIAEFRAADRSPGTIRVGRRCVALCLAIAALGCSPSLEEAHRLFIDGDHESAFVEAEKQARQTSFLRPGARADAWMLAAKAALEDDSTALALKAFERAHQCRPTVDPVILESLSAVEATALRTGNRALATTIAGFLQRHGIGLSADDEAVDDFNLILIGIDTLRADHLGAWGWPVPTSPTIDALADEGRRYQWALATSPWTAPSFTSAFTGLLPSVHGCVEYPKPTPLRPEVPTLAERLRDAGFMTAAITEGGFAGPDFGLHRGFEISLWTHPSDPTTPFLDATLDRTVEFLEEHRGQRFAAWVHTFHSHVPYLPSDDSLQRIGPDWPARTRGLVVPDQDLAERARRLWTGGTPPPLPSRRLHDRLLAYDACIRDIDDGVARILATLEDLDLAARTRIVFFSDHGEGLGEHGILEHGRGLNRELLHVPVILAGPGIESGIVHRPVSLAGLANTVLDMAGAAFIGDGSALGAPWPTTDADVFSPTISEGLASSGAELDSASIVRWPYQLILHQSRSAELYDLTDDPRSLNNLAEDRPRILSECEDAMARLLAEARRGAPSGRDRPAPELSPETAERLRALGYLD